MPPLKDVGDRSMNRNDVEILRIEYLWDSYIAEGWDVYDIKYRHKGRAKEYSWRIHSPDAIGALVEFHKQLKEI